MIWRSKCHQNNCPIVCDGYVKYEEAEVDRLVAILKTTAAAEDRVKYSKQPASGCLMNLSIQFVCKIQKIAIDQIFIGNQSSISSVSWEKSHNIDLWLIKTEVISKIFYNLYYDKKNHTQICLLCLIYYIFFVYPPMFNFGQRITKSSLS